MFKLKLKESIIIFKLINWLEKSIKIHMGWKYLIRMAMYYTGI